MSSNSPPNVVLIVADDMGWGDVGCNGATQIPTPHMDAIARDGLRATDAHSASAVCTPSRYAIMTGRYAWRSPLKRFVLMGHGPALIEPDRSTIASLLQGAGYRTGAFGKWHLGLGWKWKDGHRETAFGADARMWIGDADAGWEVDYAEPFVGGPLDLGFDRFFGISGSLDMPPYCFIDQDRTLGIPDRPKENLVTSQRPGLQVHDWRDDEVDVRVVQEAAAWLDEGGDLPFFLYLAPAAPHRPCVPPDFVKGRTGLGDRADSVCLVDWMVGQVEEALIRTGTRDNTLVIVTSDNGAPMVYPEDGDTETHRPNGPYRGQKGDIWDGGHREPLVMRWPDRIPVGTTIDSLVGLVDLYATIAGAAGLESPEGAAEDSANRWGLLSGKADDADVDQMMVHHSLEGRFAIRLGTWKVIFCTGSGGGFSDPAGEPFDAQHPTGQLYDLDADPFETNDLWRRRPDIVAEAYETLQRICLDPASGLPFGVPVHHSAE